MMLRRTKNSPQSAEHGDWRLPLDKPEEAEHLPPQPLGMWRRLKLRVAYWQTAPFAQQQTEVSTNDPPVIPIRGWSRALRLVFAWVVLLPVSIIMVYALLLHLYHHAGEMVGQRSFWLSVPVWYSLLGTGAFVSLVISRVALPVMVYIYVVGHELTHAIAAKLCLGRVQTLRVDLNGGYVETDTDNLFIALSPYFVPLWMFVWLLVLWCINLVYPFPEWAAWFYAGFGFWWSFHLYWTVWVIPREQPDMLENGLLFSLLLVLIMNIGILLAVLYAFGVLSPSGYGQDFVTAARDTWQHLYDICSQIVRAVQSY